VIATLRGDPLSATRRASAKPVLYTVLFAQACRSPRSWSRSTCLFLRLQLIDSMPATAVFLATPRAVQRSGCIKGFIDNVPTQP